MILVDSSVWIDLFKKKNNEKTKLLLQLIEDEEDICTCGLIITEVLQGIREDLFLKKVENYFRGLILLKFQDQDFTVAAYIYRKARKKGVTIRSTVDCVIAACAIRNSIILLERDRDYQSIAKYSSLKLL